MYVIICVMSSAWSASGVRVLCIAQLHAQLQDGLWVPVRPCHSIMHVQLNPTRSLHSFRRMGNPACPHLPSGPLPISVQTEISQMPCTSLLSMAVRNVAMSVACQCAAAKHLRQSFSVISKPNPQHAKSQPLLNRI